MCIIITTCICVEIGRISGPGEVTKGSDDEHGRCTAAGSELLHRRQETRVCSFAVSYAHQSEAEGFKLSN